MSKMVWGIIGVCAVVAATPAASLSADKWVAYLSLGDYTGPAAGTIVSMDKGARDFFQDLNNKGGVDGVKVKFIGVDTRYDVARGVSAYKNYQKTPRLLAVNSVSTAIGQAIAPLVKRDKLVALTSGDGIHIVKIGYNFLWGECFPDFFGAVLDWIVRDWKARGKTGMPTVGYMGWDSAGAREPLKGGREYAAAVGVKLLDPVYFPVGSTDHTPYLTQLKGVDYIYIVSVGDPFVANLIRDGHRMGMTEKTQFVCDIFGPAMGAGVSLHPKELEGTVIASYHVKGTDALDHPVIKGLWTKYQNMPMNKFEEFYVFGVSWAMHYTEALKIALKDVGYEAINGEAMVKAYEKLTGKDVTQGIQGTCTYSPTERRASRQIKFYRVSGGKVAPISGWVRSPETVSLHKWE